MRNDPSEFNVLIIDDEPELLEVATYLLRRGQGVSVYSASNLVEADATLSAHKIHLIVCDYHLSGQTSETWLQQLRIRGEEALFLIYTGNYDIKEQRYPAVDGALRTVLKTDIPALLDSLVAAKLYWASLKKPLLRGAFD